MAQAHDKWLLLDAMGVVFRVGDDVADLLVPFVRQRSDVPRRVIEASYADATLGRMTSEGFWEAVGLASEYPAIEHDYLGRGFELNAGLQEALGALGGLSIRIGLVSNDVSEWSRHLRRMHDLERWLECVVISGDVGYRKPAAAIYETFVARASARAGDCVAVDDRAANLRAAASIGIRGILFGSGLSSDWAGPRVESFSELAAAVSTALHTEKD